MGSGLFLLSVLLAAAALADRIALIRTEKRVRETKATVVDVAPVGAVMQTAQMNYYAEGRFHTSENRIVVPGDVQVGDHLAVRYYIDEPARLCTRSPWSSALLLAAAVLCGAAAVASLLL